MFQSYNYDKRDKHRKNDPRLSAKLAVGLAMFLSGLGTQLAATNDWSELLTPAFVSGFIIQISGFILSVWGGIETKQPRPTYKRTRSTDNEIPD